MCGHHCRATALLASLLLGLAQLGEACVNDSMVVVIHRRTIKAGDLILKVDLDNCQHETLPISTNDSAITVGLDGSLYATRDLRVTSDQMTFNVQLQDSVTLKTWIIQVQLQVQQLQSVLQKQVRKRRELLLRRQKRRWRPRPFSIIENDIGPFPKRIQFIKSEFEKDYPVRYEISGQGVDLPPVGLLTIDPETGEIKATRSVDREEFSVLRLTGIARFSPEDPLDLIINIRDVNDNAPEFNEKVFIAKVPECSAVGTSVLNLTATDRDEPQTLNTLLRYRILNQVPPSKFGTLFSINEGTGEIKTDSNKLNREEHEKYTLTVEVRDMEGRPYGLHSTGTVVVEVTDMNDHAPTFKESRYTINVREAESDIMVLRIPIEDKDIENTSASRAVFKITEGDEEGNFNVTTDPKTNDGLLYVVKPLDAEAASSIQLEIAVENEAPLVGSSTGRQVTRVTVNVLDVDEGPEFEPRIKQLWTEENVPVGKVLGSYTARDPETKSSSNIRYRKLSDPAEWISIDSNTGQIETIATLDRESAYVKNNKYNVTVLAIEDEIPSRTATGTVVINLIDVNDNRPIISNKDLYICENGNKQFVNISAEDLDASPNTAPFTFLLADDPPEIQNKWTIFKQMGSFAYMRPVDDMIPGYFEVPIIVQDQQHLESKETLKIIVCECPNGLHCADRLASKQAVLGGLGILMMVLAALLLLCLLIAAFALHCGGDKSRKAPFVPSSQYQQTLIVSNEEGGGQQDMNLTALDIPGNHSENVQQLSRFQMGHDDKIGTDVQGFAAGGISSGSQVATQEIIEIRDGMHYDQHGNLLVDSVDGTTATFGRRKSHGLMEILRSQVDQVYEEEQEDIGVPYDYVHEYIHEGRNSVRESVGSDVFDTRGLEYNLIPKNGTMTSISLKK